MPTVDGVALTAFVALLLWGGTGWAVARRVVGDPALALAVAPALGWAVQSVLALPAAMLFGLTGPVVLAVAAIVTAVALAGTPSRSEPNTAADRSRGPGIALAAMAALLALVPAVALMPKQDGLGGVHLAAAIYDHAKVAIVDEMLRAGVPPANPVIGEGGTAGRLAYYYLWHFGAAQIARLSGTNGWTADVAATAYTAFATLTLVGGLAVRLSGRAAAGPLALLALMAGGVRPLLAFLAEPTVTDPWIRPQTGLTAWLFQATWAPQHAAGATAVVVFVILMAQSRRPAGTYLVLGIVAAAAFEASVWVGGVSFLAVAIATVATVLVRGPRNARVAMLWLLVLAGALAAALAAPMLLDQIAATGQRGTGLPIALRPYPVVGPAVADATGSLVARAIDLAGFWTLLPALEAPVLLVVGGLAAVSLRTPVPVAAAVASLLVAQWFASTVGENNDLGWRAVLPAILLLASLAGAAAADWLARRRAGPLALALLATLVALPDTARVAFGNLTGDPPDQTASAAFADAPALWQAVRRHTAADARVANDPSSNAALTPWPINIGWALLSDRRSCFAGRDMALAFAPLPAASREAITALVARIFDGDPRAGDLDVLADRLGCMTIVLTPASRAWNRDPFADNPRFKLEEERPDHWRIYTIRTV